MPLGSWYGHANEFPSSTFPILSRKPWTKAVVLSRSYFGADHNKQELVLISSQSEAVLLTKKKLHYPYCLFSAEDLKISIKQIDFALSGFSQKGLLLKIVIF